MSLLMTMLGAAPATVAAAGTAPTYASGEVGAVNASTVVITFSANVNSAGNDYKTGVGIKQNGSLIGLRDITATRQTDHSIVYYELAGITVYNADTVTWEYDATAGDLAGDGGTRVATIAAQTVTNTTPAAPVVSDSFAGVNGTNVTAHAPEIAPVGSAWVGNSSYTLQSNTAQHTVAGENFAALVIEAGKADGVVSVDYNTGAANKILTGMAFRYTASRVHWWLMNRNDLGGWGLYEDNNSWTQRAFVTATIAPSTTYALSATLNGASITATVDGGNTLSYGSATFNQTATKHGIADWEASQGDYFDNFKVV